MGGIIFHKMINSPTVSNVKSNQYVSRCRKSKVNSLIWSVLRLQSILSNEYHIARVEFKVHIELAVSHDVCSRVTKKLEVSLVERLFAAVCPRSGAQRIKGKTASLQRIGPPQLVTVSPNVSTVVRLQGQRVLSGIRYSDISCFVAVCGILKGLPLPLRPYNLRSTGGVRRALIFLHTRAKDTY